MSRAVPTLTSLPGLAWPLSLSCQALVTVLSCPGNGAEKEQSPAARVSFLLLPEL